jgi:hypothetical protein
MTYARLTSLVLLTALFSACGSSTPPKKIDGFWFATLQNQDGSSAYTFSATLTQNSGSTVTVSSFGFTNSAPCFNAPLGQTATFTASGHSREFQTGQFGMNISTALGTMVENVLTLAGTRNPDGSISGTWILTGKSGCSGNGAYTMTAPRPL